MGIEWWVPSVNTSDMWGVTSGTFSGGYTGGTIYVSTTGTGCVANDPPKPEPRPNGPLAWLDEHVDEIAEMGRALMESA